MSHRSQARLELRRAEDIVRKVVDHLAGHGAELKREENVWHIDFGHRRAEVTVDQNIVVVCAEGADPSLLHEMQLDLVEHIAEFGGPGILAWSGGAMPAEPPNVRMMRVESIEDLTPAMRRIRLSGQHLRRFDTMKALHCKLLLPPQNVEPVWPSLDHNGRFRLGNGIVRKYTIRRLDPIAGWMDIDVLLHDPAGPGAAWANTARVGDDLCLIGPGGGGIPVSGPALLLGDETALPAIARALETMTDGTGVTVVIEVSGPDEEQPIVLPSGAVLHWMHRGAQTSGNGLVEAVSQIAPAADCYVWAGCEFAAFKAIRKTLRQTLSHPRDCHLVTAYWRSGIAADRMDRPLARLGL